MIKSNKKLKILLIVGAVAVIIATTIALLVVLVTPNEYSIRFDTNVGALYPPIKISGKTKINPPIPNRDGYRFEGWFFDNGTFENQLKADTYLNKKLKKNVVVYAKWEFTGYLVSLDYNYDNIIEEKILGQNERFTSPSMHREGYNFLGWYFDTALTRECKSGTLIRASTTLYAKWLANEVTDYHTIYLKSSFGREGKITVIDGGTIKREDITPIREGYKLLDWYTDIEYKNPYDFSNIITKGFTLYADWEKILEKYTLAFESNGGNVVENMELSYNEIIDPPLPHRDNYNFLGWYRDINLTQRYNFNNPQNIDIILYAKWEEIPSLPIPTFKVFYYANNELAREITQQKDSYIEDWQIAVDGYIFKGWLKADNTPFDFSLPLTEDIYLYAKLMEDTKVVEGNFTYQIGEDGNYEILRYEGKGVVEIPNTYNGITISSVGVEAFTQSGITEIIIPSTIKAIKRSAFSQCKSLKKVEFKGSPRLESYLFQGCTALTNVTFHQDTQVIAPFMFGGCVALTQIVLPDNCLEIGNNAFENCINLKTVQINSKCKTIGNNAFSGVLALQNFDFSKVQKIGNRAFFNTRLTNVDLGDNVEKLGESAFGECSALTTVVIGKGLREVNNSFLGSTKITEFIVAKNEYFKGIKGDLYSALPIKTLVQYATGKNDTTFALPEGVEALANFSFMGGEYLRHIIISHLVKDISVMAFVDIPNLQSIEVAEGSDNFRSIDGVLYDNEIKTLVKYPSNREGESFALPQTVESLAPFSFMFAKNIRLITATNSLKSIGEGAFYMTESLTEISGIVNLQNIDSNAFTGCISLRQINLGTNLLKIGEKSFSGSGLTTITLPAKLIIGKGAFENCQNLEKVTFGSGIDYIRDDIFSGCTNLEHLVFNGSPVDIGNAFNNCINIATVSILGKEKVSNITENAFSKENKPLLYVKNALLVPYQNLYEGIFSDIVGID